MSDRDPPATPERHRLATVFGGTGFLGRRIVRRLAGDGWQVRVAVRRPDRVERADNVSAVAADVHDDASTASAVSDAAAVINVVSLYLERGRTAPNFQSVHVEGAARVARHAADSGAKRLVHVSGIGAAPNSPSRFIAARGHGEIRVRAAFGGATVIRPSVMFGDDDRFFNSLADILVRSPVFPLIGGSTRLQPVAADDVAEATLRILDLGEERGETFELGGPDIETMREIIEWLDAFLGVRRVVLPVPYPLARLQARLLELLPAPPLTVAQVELLRDDNVAVPGTPGLDRLGILPTRYRDVVPGYLAPRSRRGA